MLKNFPRSFEARVPAVLRFWRGAAARARPAILGLQRYPWPRQFSPRFVFAIMPSRWRLYQTAPARAASLRSRAAHTAAAKRADQAKVSTIAPTRGNATVRSSRTITSPSLGRVLGPPVSVTATVGVTPVRRAVAPLRSFVRSRAMPAAPQVRGAIRAMAGREARATVRYVVRTSATPALPQTGGPVRTRGQEERATPRSIVGSRTRVTTSTAPTTERPAHAPRRFVDRLSRIPPARTRALGASALASSRQSSPRRRIEAPNTLSPAQRPRRTFVVHVSAAETKSSRFSQTAAHRAAEPSRIRPHRSALAAPATNPRADSGQHDRLSNRAWPHTSAGTPSNPANVRTLAASARRKHAVAEKVAPCSHERARRKTLRRRVVLSRRPLEGTTDPRTASATPRLRLAQHRPHVITAEPSAPRPQARMSLRQGPTSSHSHASPSSSAHPSSSTPERRRASRIDQEQSVRNGAQSEPTVAQTRRLLLPLVQETVFSERSISRLASGVMARLDRNDSAEAYRKSGGR